MLRICAFFFLLFFFSFWESSFIHCTVVLFGFVVFFFFCFFSLLFLVRIGTCVGERNYRYFAYFLFGISAYTLYDFVTGVICLVEFAKAKAHRVNRNSSSADETWVDEFSTTLIEHIMVTFLTVFSGFVFLSVVSLALYHCHLICVAETTNENVCVFV